MHISILFGLLICQSPDSIDSPRIQPLPFQITFQTKRKPIFQDAPPSTFVPPKSTPSSNQTFDPQGDFKQIKQEQSAETQTGFQKVDADQIKPLRGGSSPKSGPPSTTFSLQSGSDSKQGKSGPGKTAFSDSGAKSSKGPSDPTGGIPSKSAREDSRNTEFNNSDSFRSNSKTTAQQVREAGNNPADGFQGNRQMQSGGQQRVVPSQTFSTVPANPGNLSPAKKTTINDQATEANNQTNELRTEPRETPREVTDPTFDPQLKQITELILKTIPRPNENRLSLQQAVSFAQNPTHRKLIVKQYWSCFVTSADQTFAQQELQLLAEIPRPQTQLDQFLLRAANSAAQARYAEAKIAYEKSAAALYKLVPQFDLDQPLSFADLPWVGKYQTNSNGFVNAGLFSDKIRRVDTALPAMRDLIYLRGAAVYDNLAAMREAIAGFENGSIKLETIIQLHKEVRDQRIEFCKNIRAYNHAIADYAISVFPNESQPLTVVSMLIDTKQTLTTDTILDRNVRQASGSAPLQNR